MSSLFKLLLALLFSLFIMSPSVMAITQSDLDSILGGTAYYDAGDCAAGPGGSVVLSGNDNAQKAYNFFVSQGLTPAQAAGLIGNMQVESTDALDPTIVNGGGDSNTPVPGKAWGIVQWLGTRITGLEDFASKKGLNIDDLATQLQFEWYELSAGSYQTALAHLKGTSTTDAAANVIFLEYEGPSDNSLPTRQSKAAAILQAYGNGVTTGGGGGVISCSSVGPGQNTQYVDGFTVYSQYDPAWANDKYGDTTIAAAGCGPSALAMVITTLTGQQITPDITAKYADNQGLYVPGTGSSWSISPQLAQHWGLKASAISADVNKINATLQSGGLVVASGQGPLPFTSAGHFLVIRGLTADGKWKIGDSGHNDTSTQTWDPQQLLTSMNSGSVYAITK